MRETFKSRLRAVFDPHRPKKFRRGRVSRPIPAQSRQTPVFPTKPETQGIFCSFQGSLIHLQLFLSISVALAVDGAVELGVIYNPYLDELFTARRGRGAFCNGKPIRVSSEPLENGIVIFGTSPYNKEVSEKSFKLAYEYHRRALDVRRTGSAAIDLCNIAAGRAELFFELILSPWDYAAGALIVEEAGGIVTDADGRTLPLGRKCSVVARNAVVQPL